MAEQNGSATNGPDAGGSSRPICPACGGKLIEIRAKLQCERCHRICETCCEGSCG
jgi:hypothetical protein